MAKVKGAVKRSANRFYVAELLLHAAGLIAIAVLAVLAVMALPAPSQVDACANSTRVDDLVGYGLAGWAIGGFLVGRGSGMLRQFLRSGLPANTPGSQLTTAQAGRRGARALRSALGLDRENRTQQTMNASAVFEFALAIFLVVAALVLGYETYSIVNHWSPPPVTSYVRCAAHYHPWISAGTVAGIGYVLSNWIWYPTKK